MSKVTYDTQYSSSKLCIVHVVIWLFQTTQLSSSLQFIPTFFRIWSIRA